MQLLVIDPQKWDESWGKIYPMVFGEWRGHGVDRIDFALVSVSDSKLNGFVTCKEMDHETIYWQFGGATDDTKKTMSVMSSYLMFINYCKEKYKRITTRIENVNISMLKLAMKCGFLIQGVWCFKNKIYVELCLEF